MIRNASKASLAVNVVAVLFLATAAALLLNLWGRSATLPPVTLIDSEGIQIATVRDSYSDLVRAGEDVSHFDCYICHERGKQPTLRFDAEMNIIIPPEHDDIVVGHGRHQRNNNCFNCHDADNLELLQTRDGRELKWAESSQLCGSCHGPTYRDWEAGVHGRINGYWNRAPGEWRRQDCVSCHDPHSPKFPSLEPLPPPRPLHPVRPASDAAPSNRAHE